MQNEFLVKQITQSHFAYTHILVLLKYTKSLKRKKYMLRKEFAPNRHISSRLVTERYLASPKVTNTVDCKLVTKFVTN